MTELLDKAFQKAAELPPEDQDPDLVSLLAVGLGAYGIVTELELDVMPAYRLRALEQPERPMLAVVGGSKVSTKLSVLNTLSGVVDQLIPGGGIANLLNGSATFGPRIRAGLAAAGIQPGTPDFDAFCDRLGVHGLATRARSLAPT